MKANWQTKKLGEICDLQNGFAFRSKDYISKSGTLNFRMSNIRPGGFVDIYHNQKFLPDNYAVKYEDFLLRDGDLVIAMTDMATETKILGVPTIIKTEGKKLLLNQRVGKFFNIQNDKIYIPFLKYMLSSEQVNDYYKSLGRGGLQINIGKQDILNVQIPVASIHDQKIIVKLLDEVFEGVAKAKANAEKNLQNSKELFESYLQSVLDNSRKKWGVRPLGELCERVEYGSSSKSKKKGRVPVMRMGNIQNGRLNWDSLKYSDDNEEIEKYLLKHNDVLFNRTNSPELVGKTAIYKGEMPAIFAGYLIRIHRKEKLLDADYLNYFLNSNEAKEHGKSVVISSVNQANINGQKLKNYPIPVPPLTDQKSIVKKIDALSAETKKLEANYRKKLLDLEELKKSVLKKAFAGKL